MARSRRGSFRGKVTHNAAQQRSKASNYGHLLLPRGVHVFEEEAGGRIALDFLPYFVAVANHPDRDDERETAVEGSLWYRRPYKLHRSIGVDNKSIVCPTSFGRKCPICEERSKRLASGSKWDDDEIKAMRPSDRNLYYVVPRGSKKHEEKPYVWDISRFCFQDALNNELEENEEFGDFPELDNGLTLRIRFSEEKFMNNSFAKTSRIDFEQRDYKYDEAVVRELTPLDDVLDAKDYREVERLFFDTGGDDDPEDDGGEIEGVRRTPEPTRSMTRPKDGGTITSRGASPPRGTRDPDPDDGDDNGGGDDDNGGGGEEETPPPPARALARSETTARPAGTNKPSASPTKTVIGKGTAEKPPPKKNGAAEGKCPSNYEFGVDVDKYSECEECPVWDACMDARDAAA